MNRKAVLCVASWIAVFVAASQFGPTLLGDETIGGQPRWRCAVALPTQLTIMPLLRCGVWGRQFSRDCFTLLFAAYMIVDLILVNDMSIVLISHHWACLLGHIAVLSTNDGRAFEVYFDGVTFLELGSGFMNVFLFKHDSLWRSTTVYIYAVGMTLSNALSANVLRRWLYMPMSSRVKATTTCMTLGILLLRQRSLYENMRLGT